MVRKTKPFSTLWKEASEEDEKTAFSTIRELAEDLYDVLSKAGTSAETIESLITVLNKIDSEIEWCIQNLLESDEFTKWLENTFKNHIHLDGKVYLPMIE